MFSQPSQVPKAFRGEDAPPPAFDKLRAAYKYANDCLKEAGFIAGTDHMTIADLSMVSFYGTAHVCKFVDMSAYPELAAWYAKMKSLIPNFEQAYQEGHDAWAGVMGAKIGL